MNVGKCAVESSRSGLAPENRAGKKAVCRRLGRVGVGVGVVMFVNFILSRQVCKKSIKAQPKQF